MVSPDTPIEPPPAPPQFSLRTMFLIINCIAIAFAAFRLGNPGVRFVAASLGITGFLTVWFLATGQFHQCAWPAGAAAVICVFLVMQPALQSPRESPPRTQCMNNLKQITIAIENYHVRYGSFPPAYVADATGRPLYSWRVLILPFMDQQALYRAFHLDEAWDGPNNRKLSQIPLAAFHCPSDEQDATTTDYLAVVGPNTVWPGVNGRNCRRSRIRTTRSL